MAFDGQVVRPSKEFIEAARDYVCIRVVDMTGVDLSKFSFDFDLTFAVLLMNGDGTIYHRYGTREAVDPEARLSMVSLVRAMKETLEDHRAYVARPSPPAARPKETIERLWKESGRAEAPECFHCHMVGEARRTIAKSKNAWDRGEIYKYPEPERVGLSLDRDDQTRVTAAAAGSAAARAGLRKGDRLVRVAGARVRTIADVQWQLETVPAAGGKFAVEFERDGKTQTAQVTVARDWRVADPLVVSWRSTMWSYRPEPGFWGRTLGAAQLAEAGLPAGAWALKVEGLVDWGDAAKAGANAAAAGIRKGDLILSVGGKRDFKTEQHFPAWFRFTQKPGAKVPVGLMRDGQRKTVTLAVVE
jgi:hypothetical protein